MVQATSRVICPTKLIPQPALHAQIPGETFARLATKLCKVQVKPNSDTTTRQNLLESLGQVVQIASPICGWPKFPDRIPSFS
jgi:hypothetical protein